MAPKKKIEEAVERPPEGDDERLLSLTLTLDMSQDFVSSLRSPILSVGFPNEELHRFELPQDTLQSGRLSATIFTKKITISATFVETVLTDVVSVALLSLPETVKEVAPQPKGKGPAPVKGKAPTSVMEMSIDDLTSHWSISFDFCDTFRCSTVTYDVTHLSGGRTLAGVDAGKLVVTLNDPMLAPSNLNKYLPVVIQVTEATNFPSRNPIPLEHSGHLMSEWNDQHEKIFVQFEFMGDLVRTEEIPKGEVCHFRFRKAFFLFKLKKLELIQRLTRPLEFEIHEQLCNGKSKLRPSFGSCFVNVSAAVQGVHRFASSSQILPVAREVEGFAPPLDYLSFGTTLKTVVEFLSPIPKPTFVNELGAPSEALSRCLLRMPYDGMSSVLQAVMGTLVTLKKGGAESRVREFEAPVPEGKKGSSPTPSSTPQSSGFKLIVPAGVSGFEVMDGSMRLMCFEGPLSIVHKIAEVATCILGDDQQCIISINTELPFYERLYNVWPSLVVAMEERKAPSLSPQNEVKTAPTGKKAPPPPKKKAEPDQKSPTPPIPEEESPPEIDAGGVGGRIRRIRLDSSLDRLASNQRNFVKRTLPLEALRCISKLKLLKQARSVLHSVELNIFPSASELVALERVHGQTLELMDVCGSNDFLSFSEADVGNIVMQATRDANAVKPVEPREVDITSLTSRDVGAVISFVGMPASGKQCEGVHDTFSHEDTARFPHRALIFSLDHHTAVNCAFSTTPPSQMLRHAFTAQIIKGGSGEPLVFVIDCRSLAKNSSDHINASYDKKLRRDKLRAPANEYFSQLAARKSHYLATHTLASAANAYKDESSDDEEGFIDAAPLSSKGLEQAELIPNYVELNKSVPEAALSNQPHGDDNYRKAIKLFESQSKRLQRMENMGKSETVLPTEPFRTIISKTSVERRAHPLAPSQQRVDDLHQPWIPPATFKTTKDGPIGIRFDGAANAIQPVKGHTELSDAETRLLEDEASRQRDLAQWREKVVVTDGRFHVSSRLPTDVPPSQLEKLQSLLQGSPQKIAFKKSFVPPAPPSIFTHEIPTPRGRVDPSTSKHPDQRRFYYSKAPPPSKMSSLPITANERLSPLFHQPQ